MLQAWSYGNSLGGGPSTVIVMRLFSILLERRFLYERELKSLIHSRLLT